MVRAALLKAEGNVSAQYWLGFGTASCIIGMGILGQAQGWVVVDFNWTNSGLSCVALGAVYFVYGALKSQKREGT